MAKEKNTKGKEQIESKDLSTANTLKNLSTQPENTSTRKRLQERSKRKRFEVHTKDRHSTLYKKLVQTVKNPWTKRISLGLSSLVLLGGLGLITYNKIKSPKNLESEVLQYINENPGSRLPEVSISVGSSNETNGVLSELIEQRKVKIKDGKYFSVQDSKTPSTSTTSNQTDLEFQVLNYLNQNQGSSLLKIYSKTESVEETYLTLADLLDKNKIKIEDSKFYTK